MSKVDYREILRLDSLHYSRKRISISIGSSHHTVKDVLDTATQKGITWPLDNDVTNAELEALLFPDKRKTESIYAELDYAYIHRELAKTGVTLTLLWEEYCRTCHESGRTPYMSTQFGDKYRKWARITKATMRITHKPGDAMEVDWAGDTIPVFDPVTGEADGVYLFVAVLPCSCYVYAEACNNMASENWLLCHVHAYNYFGGVARLLIPDNCKTSTISNTRYDTVLNKSYQELAEHYNTAIVPARVKAPQDKSHAEGSVKFAETWIIAALRNQKFFSLDEVKDAVAEKLKELNSRPFKSRVGNRIDAYLTEEKPYMMPLPTTDFEPAVWSSAKVPNDYLISDGQNRYSVPANLIGERVDIRTTRNMVEVFFHGAQVALHKRVQSIQYEPIVKPEHMTPEHRSYLRYNTEDFTSWAESVGSDTSRVVQYYLTSGAAPEQGYKACASLMKLGDKYGAKRLENACGQLLAYSSVPSIRNLSSMLKNGQDRISAQKQEPIDNVSHGFTCGAAYYRKGGEQK